MYFDVSLVLVFFSMLLFFPMSFSAKISLIIDTAEIPNNPIVITVKTNVSNAVLPILFIFFHDTRMH
jgi:hypothetical protein